MIRYYVRVRTKEQLGAVLLWGGASVLMADGELTVDIPYVLSAMQKSPDPPQLVLCLPDVLRQSRLMLTETGIMSASSCLSAPAGLLIRNLDELGMVCELGLQDRFQGGLIADSFLYACNSEALRFYLDLFPDLCFIASDELTDREQQQALRHSPLSKEQVIIKVYGHQALMISNQCMNRNYTNCREHLTSFLDNHKERFFAVSNCTQCYSTIYNGKCTWLLDKVREDGYDGYDNLLLDFTVEDGHQMERILASARSAVSGGACQVPLPDHMTRAHHVKGAE